VDAVVDDAVSARHRRAPDGARGTRGSDRRPSAAARTRRYVGAPVGGRRGARASPPACERDHWGGRTRTCNFPAHPGASSAWSKGR